jgi:hypothetical protein
VIEFGSPQVLFALVFQGDHSHRVPPLFWRNALSGHWFRLGKLGIPNLFRFDSRRLFNLARHKKPEHQGNADLH